MKRYAINSKHALSIQQSFIFNLQSLLLAIKFMVQHLLFLEHLSKRCSLSGMISSVLLGWRNGFPHRGFSLMFQLSVLHEFLSFHFNHLLLFQLPLFFLWFLHIIFFSFLELATVSDGLSCSSVLFLWC